MSSSFNDLERLSRLEQDRDRLLEAAETALANLHARSTTRKKWSVTDQLSYEMLEKAISKTTAMRRTT